MAAAAPGPALTPFLDRWNLEFLGRPASPGGRTPYPGTGEVAFVRRGGEPLVLKLMPAATDEGRSGEVLAHWRGEGAVRVIETAPGAVLIERAVPGDDLCDLARSGRDDEATEILCQVMAQLNRPPPAARVPFRSVADWGKGFARTRDAARKVGMDAAMIDRAEAMFFDLCATSAPAILLHGDLQHYNVVCDTTRGWLAIDPKGILGEPAYEPGALLRNPTVCPELFTDPKVLARRIEIISARLRFDPSRVARWCFAQWVLSVLWAIEDGLSYEPAWLAGPLAAASLL